MSLGNMNTFIDIIEKRHETDDEGFSAEYDVVLARVRAYREGRHGSEKWANRAAFSAATDLFRIRSIPGTQLRTDMVILCGDERFEITSVENIKGRGMYIEILAKEVRYEHIIRASSSDKTAESSRGNGSFFRRSSR